jgi:hypothetical protein
MATRAQDEPQPFVQATKEEPEPPKPPKPTPPGPPLTAVFVGFDPD